MWVSFLAAMAMIPKLSNLLFGSDVFHLLSLFYFSPGAFRGNLSLLDILWMDEILQ